MSGAEQKVTWKGSGSHVFVDGVQSFSFNRRGGTAETTVSVTTQDLKDKTFLGTLREGTASIKLRYVNMGDTNGQADMWDNVGAKTPIETIFYLDAATKLTADCIVTSFNLDDPVDGIVSGSIDLQISGAVTAGAV